MLVNMVNRYLSASNHRSLMGTVDLRRRHREKDGRGHLVHHHEAGLKAVTSRIAYSHTDPHRSITRVGSPIIASERYVRSVRTLRS